jgi:hypothetical protein
MSAIALSRWKHLRQILMSQGVTGLFEEVSARLRYRLERPAGQVSYYEFRVRDWDRRRGVETIGSVEQEEVAYDNPSREYAPGPGATTS